MDVERKKKEVSVKEAIERLERSCSSREMCVSQVESKLYQWGIDASERAAIVESLVGNRYLDDRRFAIAFARDKSRFDKWGPQKIKMHLQAKRIDSDYVAEAMLEVEQSEIPASLVRELERKAETVKAKNTYELKNKLVAFGLRKGFGYDLISKEVDRIIKK